MLHDSEFDCDENEPEGKILAFGLSQTEAKKVPGVSQSWFLILFQSYE